MVGVVSRTIYQVLFLCLLLGVNSSLPFTESLSTTPEYQQEDKIILSSTKVEGADNEYVLFFKENNQNYISLYDNYEQKIEINDFEGFSNVIKYGSSYYVCPKGENQALYKVDFSNSIVTPLSKEKNMSSGRPYKMNCHYLSKIGDYKNHIIFIQLLDYIDEKNNDHSISRYDLENSEMSTFDLNRQYGKYTKDSISRKFEDKFSILSLYIHEKGSNSQNFTFVFWKYANEEKNSFSISSVTKLLKTMTIAISEEKSVGKFANYGNKSLIFFYEPEKNSYYSTHIYYRNTEDINNASPLFANIYFDFFPILLHDEEAFTIHSIDFFNRETRFGYYKVVSQLNKIYVGVIDILNNIIIYNTNQQDAESVSNFLFPGSLLFFGFNSGEKFSKICAFEKVGENCVDDSVDGMNIDLEKGNEYSGSGKYNFDNYYFDSFCPFGYTSDSNNKCTYCKNKISSSGCEDECDSGKRSFGKLCYDCEDFGKVVYYGSTITVEEKRVDNGSCISKENCPNNAVKSDTSCQVCSNIGKVKKGEECIDECPEGFGNEKGICENCLSKSKYEMNRECLSSCPEGTEVDKTNGICITCQGDNPYLSTSGKCTSKCEKGEIITEKNICQKCPENFYVFNNECIDKCPNGAILIEGKECVQCDEDKVAYENVCQSSCPVDMGRDGQICKSCGEDEIVLNGKCVAKAECPENSEITESGKVCNPCGDKHLMDKSCVDSCPTNGYIASSGICVDCGEKHLVKGEQPSCSAKCPEGYEPDENSVCKECENFYEDDHCVSSCSQGYEARNKICKLCKSEGNYYYNGKCLPSCPEGSKIIENSVCIKCSETENKYYEDSDCVASCKEQSAVLSGNVCSYCPDQNKYLVKGSCSDDCPLNAVKDEEKKTCEVCKDSNKYLSATEPKKCVEKCNDNEVHDDSLYTCTVCPNYIENNKCVNACENGSIYNKETKACSKCKDNEVVYNNECVAKCPSNMVVEDKVCQFCNKEEEYAQEGKCIRKEECKGNMYVTNSDTECKRCGDKHKYKESCVENCEGGYIDSESVCIVCSDENKKLFNNTCVERCEKPYVEKNNICQKCEDSQYYEGGVCVSECSPGSEIQEGNVCLLCSSVNKYLYKGKCEENCPEGSVIKENNICQKCSDENKFKQGDNCVEKCNDLSEVLENNICKTCSEANEYFINGYCSEECPTYAEKDPNKYTCKICKEQNPPEFLSKGGTCEKSCGTGEIYDENKVCKTCEKYIYNNKCIDKCPEGATYDSNNLCTMCPEGEVVFNNKCEKQCPSYTAKKEKTCYECEAGKQYARNGECIEKSECEENSLIIDEKECRPCGELHKLEEECVKTCPKTGYVNQETQVCVDCSKTGKYLLNSDTCVDTCTSPLVPSEGVCTFCPNNQKYEGGVCVVGCKAGSTVEAQNVCRYCKDEGLYFEDNKCVEKCESGSKYDTNNVCVKCSDTGKFLEDGECVDSCSKGSYFDDTNTCISCKKEGKWVYGKSCIDECVDSAKDEENKICKKCEDPEPYLDKQENKCVSKCSEGSILNDARTECVYCKDSGKHYYNSKCYEECPDYTIVDEVSSYCKPCETGKFFFNKKCLDACPEHTFKKKTQAGSGYCEQCKDNLFYSDGACVNKCEEKQKSWKDENGISVCSYCSSFVNKPYYYQNECYSGEDCPGLSVPNEEEKVCEEKCKFECFNEGTCNKLTNSCDCKAGFSGLYCEINNEVSNDRIKIYSVSGKITQGAVNLLAYETDLFFSNGYDITWKVTDDVTKEEINEEYYLNGKKDEKLKLSESAFESVSEARIQIEILDYATYENYVSFIKVSFSSLDPGNFDFSIILPDNISIIKPMRDSVKMFVTIPESRRRLRRLSKDYDSLTYTFSYLDSDGEEIPIRVDDKKIFDSTYEGVVPLTNTIIVTITDGKGQSIKLQKSIAMQKDDSPKILLDIFGNNSLEGYRKLLETYNNIIHNIDKTFTKSDIKFIKAILESNEDNPSNDKVILALLNYLVKNGNVEDFSTLQTLLDKMIQKLPSMTFDDEDKIKAFYRNLDASLNKTIANSDTSGMNMTEYVENTKKNLKKLNELFIDTLVKGETVQIQTSSFKTYLEKPGRTQENLAFYDDEDEEEKEYDKYSDYAITHKGKKKENSTSEEEDECEGSTFCVNKESYKSFKTDSSLKGKSDDITVSVVKMNNTNIYKDKGLSPMTTSSVISSVYTDNKESNEIPLAYSLSLKISPDYDLTKINAGSVCVPMSDINNPRVSCKTYFNYKTNRTICKCKNTGEITGLFDETLANFYKLLQFPKLSINMLNPLSGAFICCSLMIMIIFSIVLLIYDYIDDKNEMTYIEMSEPEKVKKELDDIKGLKDTKIFGLAWFVTQNVFPFFEMVSIYNYKQPRYIRFIIQMISMLVSLLFSIIPYYKTKFTYKEIFIDERDIEKESWDINNLPTKIWDVISGLIYSVCASISIIIIVSIFSFLLKFKALLLETWKYRKKIILGYIRKNLVNDKVAKMERLRTRIDTVCAFIGIYKKIKEMRKKGINYKRFEESSHNDDVSLEIGHKIRKKMQKKHKLGIYSLEEENTESSKNYNVNKFFIEKGGEIQLNLKSTKHMEEEQRLKEKIKEIRRRYSKSEDIVLGGIKFGRKRKLPSGKGYDSKTIEMTSNLHNYSFFNITENTQKKKEDCGEKIDIMKTIIASIIMVLIIGLIYYYLIVMFADIYERYHFYIVKVWLLPSLINLTIVRLVTSYVQNLAYILVVIFFYETRYKTTISKLLFKFVIPKYLIYTYKVQMMLNKYHDMLEKDLELKCSYKPLVH